MKTSKLGKLVKITIGRTPSRSNSNFWDKEKITGNKWFSIADLLNVNGRVTNDSKEYVTNEAANMFAVVPKGTLLVSFKLTLGRLAFAGHDLRTNEAIAALHNNESNILNEYLYYYLSYFDWLNYAASDQKVKGLTLNKAKLSEIPITYPESLEEQRRVVAKLDAAFEKIDRAIELTQQNLENSHNIFKSYFSNIFKSLEDENTVKISDIFRTGAGGTPLKSHKEYYANGDIPWLRSGEVCTKNILASKLNITQSGLDNSSAKLFPKNSVLVAMYGATAGQVGILRFQAATNQAICAILPNEKVLPEFMYYAVFNQKKYLISQAVGNAQPNVSQIKIKNLRIPRIDIAKQKSVVLEIEKIENQTNQIQDNYRLRITYLKALKQSMLEQAFNDKVEA